MTTTATTPPRRKGLARPDTVRVGLYCRISNDPTGQRAGVERQERECRALAERHGWEVAGVYIDNDVSAYSGRTRPEFERLLVDVERRRVDQIIAWHTDRLYRRSQELVRIIDLAESTGVGIATVQAGVVDLTTANGRLVARLGAAVAQHESEHKGERQRAAGEDRARSGKAYPRSVRCFGYDSDNVRVREDEAALVREAARRLVAGESLRSVCGDLNRRGIRTSTGREWSANTLRTLMLNPRLIGKRTYKGEVVADGPQPAILDPETHERLKAMFADPARQELRLPQTRRYLLTGGLVVCKLCGADLQAQPSNAGKRGYVCKAESMSGKKGCGKIRIAADPLEEEVAAQVIARLASPKWRQRLAAATMPDGDDVDTAALAVQAQELEQRKLQAAQDYADDLIDRADYLAMRKRLDARLADVRESMRQAARLQVLPEPNFEELTKWWDEASLDSRRELVATVLDFLEVDKSTRLGHRGLDLDRIPPQNWHWKA